MARSHLQAYSGPRYYYGVEPRLSPAVQVCLDVSPAAGGVLPRRFRGVDVARAADFLRQPEAPGFLHWIYHRPGTRGVYAPFQSFVDQMRPGLVKHPEVEKAWDIITRNGRRPNAARFMDMLAVLADHIGYEEMPIVLKPYNTSMAEFKRLFNAFLDMQVSAQYFKHPLLIQLSIHERIGDLVTAMRLAERVFLLHQDIDTYDYSYHWPHVNQKDARGLVWRFGLHAPRYQLINSPQTVIFRKLRRLPKFRRLAMVTRLPEIALDYATRLSIGDDGSASKRRIRQIMVVKKREGHVVERRQGIQLVADRIFRELIPGADELAILEAFVNAYEALAITLRSNLPFSMMEARFQTIADAMLNAVEQRR